MNAPPLPGVMICCFSTVQRRPSCSITCPARIRFACCFIMLAYGCWELRASKPGQGPGQAGPWPQPCASHVMMSAALRKPMTLQEFLDWEERQELRYEFDGSQPEARTGGAL